MISQSLFLEIGRRMYALTALDPLEKEWEQFVRPYVLVIHKSTGNGFYLDRNYRHIIDVKICKEPENPVEVAREHLSAGPNLPTWVAGLKVKRFDTFWLY